jgi:5'-nucleotidase
MVDILLTNDDGYRSAGFLPLLKALSAEYSVLAVTPSTEKSWIGKCITTNKEISVRTVKVGPFKVHSVTGTPADCVQVGLYNILRTPPKLVVSGINLGVNAGHARILSSGTLGAAMEAAIEGVRSLASSIYLTPSEKKGVNFFSPRTYPLFKNPAKITLKLVKKIFELDFCKDFDLLSMNMGVQARPDSDIELTRPFKAPYGQLFYPTKKKGRFLHKNPPLGTKDMADGTDLKALKEGRISITPVGLDLLPKGSTKNLEDALKIW